MNRGDIYLAERRGYKSGFGWGLALGACGAMFVFTLLQMGGWLSDPATALYYEGDEVCSTSPEHPTECK